MRKLLSPIYNKIGGFEVSASKSDKLDAVKHQVLINNWACRLEVPNCIADALGLFKKYQKDPENKQMYVTANFNYNYYFFFIEFPKN